MGGIIVKNFLRLLLLLILILLLEIFLIFKGYQKSKDTMYKIDNYDSKKPIVILIDVSCNKLCVFQNDNLLKEYSIASGKESTPSPIGTWTVVHKGEWTGGFGGHWMGFNVPWGIYGIHGTIYPSSIGWNSSHGCIRMRNSDVSELYKITQIGTKVIISGGTLGNFGEGLKKIKPGDRGSDVYELQRIMKEKGYYNGNIDGIYGSYMQQCIHKFQKDNKLTISNTIGQSFYNKLGVKVND